MLLGGLLDGLIASSTGAVPRAAGRRDRLLRHRGGVVPAQPDHPRARAEVDGRRRASPRSAASASSSSAPGFRATARAIWPTWRCSATRSPPTASPTRRAPGEAYADETLEAERCRARDTVHRGRSGTDARSRSSAGSRTPATRGQGSLWAVARHLARGPEREPPRRRGSATACSRRSSSRGDGAGLRRRHRRGHRRRDRLVHPRRGGRRHPRRRPAAGHVQPDHRGDPGRSRSSWSALFFALLTVERTALYGVLKAVGASSRRSSPGVVAQAVVVTAIAATVGGLLAAALDAAHPARVRSPAHHPRRLHHASVAFLLVAAVLGCAFSLRRVLRIDPASAIGTGS